MKHLLVSSHGEQVVSVVVAFEQPMGPPWPMGVTFLFWFSASLRSFAVSLVCFPELLNAGYSGLPRTGPGTDVEHGFLRCTRTTEICQSDGRAGSEGAVRCRTCGKADMTVLTP